MTGEEYCQALEALGLSQVAAARLLGVNPRTSRRWALGERDVPAPAAQFLYFLIAAECSGAEALKVMKL